MMDKVASISLLLPDASGGTCLGRIQAWDFVRLIKLLMAWTAYMGLSIVCLRLPTKTLANAVELLPEAGMCFVLVLASKD
jgi:hypothetical protein